MGVWQVWVILLGLQQGPASQLWAAGQHALEGLSSVCLQCQVLGKSRLMVNRSA